MTIGETLADADDPRPLPVITVDEPSLSMVIGINTSPLAGRSGERLTARQIKDRLDRELIGNVSIRVLRHRASRRLGGRGPRRAAAGRADRDDATRGLRADGRATPGDHPRDRRQALRAGRAARDRRSRGVRRRRHPDARRPQGPDGADGQPRDRLGAARVPGPGARPDRIPHRVSDRDPRHRPDAPRLRPLGAVGRASCGRGRPDRWSPTAAAAAPASRCSACRNVGRCSSGRAKRSTRA